MKNMKRIIYLMLTLLIAGAASVNAQVAISPAGTPASNPHQATLLDLQNGTENLGLHLPNVSLNDANVFQLATLTTADDKNAAIGMTIYNTNGSLADGKGIYIWEGCKWEKISENSVVVTDPLVIGGNTYSTARFGTAGIWMTENLREVPSEGVLSGAYSYVAQHYNIPQLSTANTTPADTIAKYGYLYNWKAAMGSTGSTDVNSATNYIGEKGNKTDAELNALGQLTYPVQGICPSGWHLPSDYEWNELEKVLAFETNRAHYTGDACGTPSSDWSNTATGYHPIAADGNAGSPTLDMKMRAPVKTWTGTYIAGVSKTKDEGGFAALPAGYWSDGSPGSFGSYASFCSSSSSTSTVMWRRTIDTTRTGVYRDGGSKRNLYSVRCKKDN
jgi:uncharacterized protein (TIGR02145 family)